MRITSTVTLLVFLAAASWQTALNAQVGEESEGVAIVARITPVHGQASALGDAITTYHHFMGDKEGAMRFTWFSILSGPDTGSYIARSGNHDWADFDGSYDWQEAAGERFAAEVAPHIQDLDVLYTVQEQDWGIWPDDISEYTLFSVTEWHVRAGRVNDFRGMLSRVDAILKKAGFPNYYTFSRVVSGGTGYTLMLVTPRKNFADMSPKDPAFFSVMSEAMGGDSAATEFLSEWGATYEAGQNMLIKRDPGLSDYGDSE